jgi:hypothetical protein
MKGLFYGVGIEYFMLNDTVYISGVVENAPAWNNNIKPGQIILKIDEDVVSGVGMTESSISEKIKGKKIRAST